METALGLTTCITYGSIEIDLNEKLGLIDLDQVLELSVV